MRVFSKKAFCNTESSRPIRRTMKSHLDVLDGVEVRVSEYDSRFFECDYSMGGEDYHMYPIYEEWTEERIV